MQEQVARREHGLRYSNTYVTISPLTGIRLAEYPDPSGRSSFRRGFDNLEEVDAATVSS